MFHQRSQVPIITRKTPWDKVKGPCSVHPTECDGAGDLGCGDPGIPPPGPPKRVDVMAKLMGSCTDVELLGLWMGPHLAEAIAAAAELRDRRQLANQRSDGHPNDHRRVSQALSVDLELEEVGAILRRCRVPMYDGEGGYLAVDERVRMLAKRYEGLERDVRVFIDAISRRGPWKARRKAEDEAIEAMQERINGPWPEPWRE